MIGFDGFLVALPLTGEEDSQGQGFADVLGPVWLHLLKVHYTGIDGGEEKTPNTDFEVRRAEREFHEALPGLFSE